MERQGSGAILNSASIGASTGNLGIAPTTRPSMESSDWPAAALDYVKRRIRVNAVYPGLIDTRIARDVVNGDERGVPDLAKRVPIERAGRSEETVSVVL